MPTPVRDTAELDPAVWREGMAMFNRYVSPWLTLTDDRKFQATVDRIAALGASHIAGCHTPVLNRQAIPDAMDITRLSPYADITPEPDQTLLDEIQQMMATAAVDPA